MYRAVIGWENKLDTLSFVIVLPENSLSPSTLITLEVKSLSVEYLTLYFETIWSE